MGLDVDRAGGPKPLPRFNRPAARPTGQRKRVLIVDDSATMRAIIRKILSEDSRLEVIGEAEDPYAAREAVKRLRPDVITLDIEMPRMSGLEFLEKLMRLNPLPVVMLSTLTAKGSEAAVRSLGLGAVDCLCKPRGMGDLAGLHDFAERVWNAANARVMQPPQRAAIGPAPVAPGLGGWNGKLVLIGSSTGGVGALEKVLRNLPADGPPIAITQHMPEDFLVSFAERLNTQFPQNIRLASQTGRLAQGEIVIAPGRGTHLHLSRRGAAWSYQLIDGPKRNGHCPSVDTMFESAQSWAGDVVAVILTGLGRDGAAMMKRLAENGARTIGQDEASCVVYGMPRAAFEMGAVQTQLPIDQIGAAIATATSRRSR